MKRAWITKAPCTSALSSVVSTWELHLKKSQQSLTVNQPCVYTAANFVHALLPIFTFLDKGFHRTVRQLFSQQLHRQSWIHLFVSCCLKIQISEVQWRLTVSGQKFITAPSSSGSLDQLLDWHVQSATPAHFVPQADYCSDDSIAWNRQVWPLYLFLFKEINVIYAVL